MQHKDTTFHITITNVHNTGATLCELYHIVHVASVPRLLQNVNLCTPWALAQLQCSHSGAGEPGNEVTIHLYIHTCTFKHIKYSLLNHSHL